MMPPATVSAFPLNFHDMCNIASQMVGKWGRLWRRAIQWLHCCLHSVLVCSSYSRFCSLHTGIERRIPKLGFASYLTYSGGCDGKWNRGRLVTGGPLAHSGGPSSLQPMWVSPVFRIGCAKMNLCGLFKQASSKDHPQHNSCTADCSRKPAYNLVVANGDEGGVSSPRFF